jgi:hypothetical protein
MTMMCMLLRNRRRRGAAVVEAALLLPLFLTFWFGIADWGIAFWVHETIVQRANAAVRWGVVNSYDEAKIRNVFLYGDPAASGNGSAWFSLQPPKVVISPPNLSDLRTARITMTVSDYQWQHFTPFFSGTYLGKPITVSLSLEDGKDGY